MRRVPRTKRAYVTDVAVQTRDAHAFIAAVIVIASYTRLAYEPRSDRFLQTGQP
jgi:hypothetical protein